MRLPVWHTVALVNPSRLAGTRLRLGHRSTLTDGETIILAWLLTLSGLRKVLTSPCVTCLVLVWLARLLVIMANLLLLSCVMALMLCMSFLTCAVVVPSSWLFVVRLSELPMRPKWLRLTNSSVICALPWWVWTSVRVSCLLSSAWPGSLARALQPVRQCSLRLVCP